MIIIQVIRRGRKRKSNPFLDDEAECEDDNENENVDDDTENEDSEDSFIDNNDVVAKKSDFMESKLLEIEANKRKLMTHINGLPRAEFDKLGLTFCYTNIIDLFK